MSAEFEGRVRRRRRVEFEDGVGRQFEDGVGRQFEDGVRGRSWETVRRRSSREEFEDVGVWSWRRESESKLFWIFFFCDFLSGRFRIGLLLIEPG
jgi:hypothetical protein